MIHKRRKQKPLISIITVCRNAENTIKRTMDSVLHQTFKNYEYLIIDGNSTDNTLNIIKQYEKKFNGRMRWISESDRGVYDAMNKGINLASGKLIGILNADDWYEPSTLSIVRNKYIKHGKKVYYGLLRYWENENVKMIRSAMHQWLPFEMIPHPTCFVPRLYYGSYGMFNVRYRYAADYELLLRLYDNRCEFEFIPEVLANFSEGGISTQNLERTLKEMYTIQYRMGFMEYKIWIVKILKKNCAILLRMLGLVNE